VVKVQLLALPSPTGIPFQTSAAVAPTASTIIGLVLHPAGNISEHLVAAGLARVVDWHAGMLAPTGGMEKLRAAERLVGPINPRIPCNFMIHSQCGERKATRFLCFAS